MSRCRPILSLLKAFKAEHRSSYPPLLIESAGKIGLTNTCIPGSQIRFGSTLGPGKAQILREIDSIFDFYSDPDTKCISIGRLLKILHEKGLQRDDPRIIAIITRFGEIVEEQNKQNDDLSPKYIEDLHVDRETFHRCVTNKAAVFRQVLKKQFVIPEWATFVQQIAEIFEKCAEYTHGQVATYIPQLARAEPERWAVSICTVDGQRHSWGEAREARFCLQSVAKPFSYAIAIEELGADFVHRYVGQEPSGRFFNAICLDHANRPHNPMINAGAIVVASLLKQSEPLSDRFDFIIKNIKKFAGGGYVSFDNSTFLSERESADRNYALAYFMREHKCFQSASVNIQDTLDLYFQLCSIKTNTESLAVMAATLANGGVNPLTEERIVCNRAVRDTLSLMLSCGMYDYSGQFAFNVGIPAKSGVSGDMIIVIPNVMGIALFSPRLDQLGNTVRGVKFAEELVDTFNFHQYDNMLFSESEKSDPRQVNRLLT
ncbi:glutaminase domain-containing protein [Ditylenchus destructor]|uniref:glutaminase n=1 Tax=Ditylenchus destructor TaxID=166010 RepID=A0AAD4R3P0_9BILA|nr:glutaminase domain-containing protein [Ditylenchus destructor]